MKHKSMATRINQHQQPELAEFGQLIRERRMARSMSLRMLADKVGISHSYLAKIENGYENPSEERIVLLAECLDLDKDVLLAMAGRVSSDVLAAIIRQPVMMARIVREENSRHY